MKNKRLALKLLAKDCQIGGEYIDGNKTCAVGCLAIAAGVKKAHLAEVNEWPIYSRYLAKTRESIKLKFGLSGDELEDIQYANDKADTVEDRRKAVLKVVEAIPAT